MKPRAFVENPSDPAQVAFGRRQEQDLARKEWELWDEQLSTYEGRAFVWLVLSRLPGRMDIHGESADVYRLLGRRSVWLELYLELEQHPQYLLQMQQEGLKRERTLGSTIAAQRESERAARDQESDV